MPGVGIERQLSLVCMKWSNHLAKTPTFISVRQVQGILIVPLGCELYFEYGYEALSVSPVDQVCRLVAIFYCATYFAI